MQQLQGKHLLHTSSLWICTIYKMKLKATRATQRYLVHFTLRCQQRKLWRSRKSILFEYLCSDKLGTIQNKNFIYFQFRYRRCFIYAGHCHGWSVFDNIAIVMSKSIDSLAKFFGPEVCLFISQDDKSSVPIGRTAAAAKVQTPMLMSMQAKVRPEIPFNH